MITVHADGHAVITAKVVDRQQVFKKCVVKIGNPTPATEISLSRNTLDVLTGETTELTATVSPEGDTGYGIEWSSSNSSVATVDDNGFVLTHQKGSAVITAKVVGSEHISAVCNIAVKDYKGSNNVHNINISDSERITIYPNPVTDKLNLKIDGMVDIIQILDVNGQVLKKMKYQNNIDVSMLRSGFYFLKAGNYVTKFIKQ